MRAALALLAFTASSATVGGEHARPLGFLSAAPARFSASARARAPPTTTPSMNIRLSSQADERRKTAGRAAAREKRRASMVARRRRVDGYKEGDEDGDDAVAVALAEEVRIDPIRGVSQKENRRELTRGIRETGEQEVYPVVPIDEDILLPLVKTIARAGDMRKVRGAARHWHCLAPTAATAAAPSRSRSPRPARSGTLRYGGGSAVATVSAGSGGCVWCVFATARDRATDQQRSSLSLHPPHDPLPALGCDDGHRRATSSRCASRR